MMKKIRLIGSAALSLGVMSAGVAKWAADCACDFLNDINGKAGLKPIVTPENRNS